MNLGVFDLLGVPPADNDTPDSTAGLNVHSIALEVPITALTTNGTRPGGDDGSQGRHRRVVDSVPSVGDHRRRGGATQQSLRAGVAPRAAAGQRGRHPARAERRLQRDPAD